MNSQNNRKGSIEDKIASLDYRKQVDKSNDESDRIQSLSRFRRKITKEEALLGFQPKVKKSKVSQIEFNEQKYQIYMIFFQTILDKLNDDGSDIETSLRNIIKTLKNYHNFTKEGAIKIVPYLSRFLLDKANPLQSTVKSEPNNEIFTNSTLDNFLKWIKEKIQFQNL